MSVGVKRYQSQWKDPEVEFDSCALGTAGNEGRKSEVGDEGG